MRKSCNYNFFTLSEFSYAPMRHHSCVLLSTTIMANFLSSYNYKPSSMRTGVRFCSNENS